MNPKVDLFISNAQKWQQEFEKLRKIILESGLTEELKWGVPCYTFHQGNVVMLGGYKDNCVLSFVKGVFLKDENEILSMPGENSQSVRVIRFTSVEEIAAIQSTMKAYIYEAIEIEKLGLKVEPKKVSELIFPDELLNKFDKDAVFKSAFEALTPGRQRAYNIYFSAPKQAKSRESRIEQYQERIFNGKGFNDCICGFSKKMPSCDGSHKYLNT
jgi:uncharacterized protein YdeI (YjbR/CyaY-like superfamily)